MGIVECRDCGTVYAEAVGACPQCGSVHKIVRISVESSICPAMKVEYIQGKNPHLPSKKKVRWEVIDRDKVQDGDGVTRVHHYRLRDRDHDLYEEVVTDLSTGEIIHACKEPLSEHRGHGSARKED